MHQITVVTAMSGTSSIVPKPEAGLKLFTKKGSELFKRKAKLFENARMNNSVGLWRNCVHDEFLEVESEINRFIYDDEVAKQYSMNEKDRRGWNLYHELLDRYNVCKYFIKATT
jgi:hypothetical protein